MNKTNKDALKRLKKLLREEEIRLYGRPLPKNKIQISKKKYNRKKYFKNSENNC